MKKTFIKAAFKDDRGTISDIFYNKKIDHVAVIKSTKKCIRGNHYHKKTTQHILVIDGELEYWYRSKNSKITKKIIIKKDEMVSTPPFEIHALKINKKNEFIVFSSGLRGGKDYEKDTYRVDPILSK